MAKVRSDERHTGLRRSILDLAPLELDCMNALWPLEEATVRQVQQALADRRPRAYTTIMTILDRLAQKGVVARRKVGRAYVYVANLRNGDAQQHAVEQVIEGFFGGSREALAAHLSGNESLGEKMLVRQVPRAPQTNKAASDRPARGTAEPVREPAGLDSTLL
jgi:BlaI family penicillinase repressor